MTVDFTAIPEAYENDNMFKAMWAIRECRLGIVSTKQIEEVKDFLDICNPSEISKRTIESLLQRAKGEKKNDN
jgi:hypothetical protein